MNDYLVGMKDLFSDHAKDYAQFRPTYPATLFEWLVAQLPTTNTAWDCGTGNGQVAAVLSQYFTQVYATDISAQQLAQALPLPNVIYQVAPAEESGLPEASVDLIVVAQAVHWFSFDRFYQEVKRVLKPAGIIALIGYGLMHIDETTDAVVRHLYGQVLLGYWDAERRYIDEAYKTIPFPFVERTAPPFTMTVQWTLEQLSGYLQTWSAVKHYQKATGDDPIKAVQEALAPIWKEEIKTVSFPLLLRVSK